MVAELDKSLAELSADAAEELEKTCHAISHGSLMGARGNSGVILSQILRGLTGVLRQAGDASPTAVAEAFSAAASAAYQAVLKPIEGTILTVVRESAQAASARPAPAARCSTCSRRPAAPGVRRWPTPPSSCRS
ncbi:MAG: DAK2 domain-containing protein [Ilumatobacteraceae bacterium]